MHQTICQSMPAHIQKIHAHTNSYNYINGFDSKSVLPMSNKKELLTTGENKEKNYHFVWL